MRLTFTIPKSQWLTANGRYHWATRARATKALRERAHAEALRHKPLQTPVHAVATIRYKTNGRADPANAAPTVKALIDGIVDGGLIPDDDHTHLIGPDFRRGEAHGQAGTHIITIELQETA